ITVTPDFSFRSVKILPEILGITPQVTSGIIRFTTPAHPAQITLIFDDTYMSGQVLHLFVNEIKEEPAGENVIAFPAGFHDVRTAEGYAMTVPSDTTVYLAPGAVLYGGIRAQGNNIRICGSGMILTDGNCRSISLDAVQCDGMCIEDVIVHSHARNGWNVHLYLCSHVDVVNLKVLSTTYACTDGIDISNGREVHIRNSFVRSCDDSISIKAFDTNLASENITLDHMILWNDCNNSMVVGEESKAAYYNNISFTNIDVLFSYDDPQYHEQLDERAVMGIVLLDGVKCTNILWENIRIHKCERLACMVFRDNFWFGTVKGDQTREGIIEGVTVRNVRVFCNSGSRIANQILLEGYDENKPVKDVSFQLIQIMGIEIDETYPKLVRNKYTEEIRFAKKLL
ncbi:MAG: hypothetical protein IJB15_05020, partial [Clostridia bacterium]|nr:hypothetical protein [Clostridia bacterium]